MNRWMVALAAAPIAFAASAASAQEIGGKSYFDEKVQAPGKSLELSVATGYAQGFGQLRGASGYGMNDVARAGIAFDLGAGYRIDPRWMVGAMGEYQEFQTGARVDGGGARGFTGGAHVAFHARPYDRLDPWVQLGAGYRLLWEVPPSGTGPTVLSHGFEIARLALGLDVRTTADVAVAPVIGADLTTFVWQSAGAAQTNVPISDPRVSTFVFAGVQGRFDLMGPRTAEGTGTGVASR